MPQPSFQGMPTHKKSLGRVHGRCSALYVTAKWFWGIGAPVVVVVLATVITNAMGLTGS